jgi:hypothetical protein
MAAPAPEEWFSCGPQLQEAASLDVRSTPALQSC